MATSKVPVPNTVANISINSITESTESGYFKALGNKIIEQCGDETKKGFFINVWSSHYTSFGFFQHTYSSNIHRVSAMFMCDISTVKLFNYNASTDVVNIKTITPT